jgi:hypothetical protein
MQWTVDNNTIIKNKQLNKNIFNENGAHLDSKFCCQFACFLLFCCYLLFIGMLFLNKNSNKICILFKKLKLPQNGMHNC